MSSVAYLYNIKYENECLILPSVIMYNFSIWILEKYFDLGIYKRFGWHLPRLSNIFHNI